MVFRFLHSETKKPKIQNNKNTTIQKKTVPAFSVNLCFIGFLVLVRVWFRTDETRAQTRYLWKSTNSPVGGGVLKGMVCHGGGVTIYTYVYMYMFMYTYIYIYTNAYIERVYVYIYIYPHIYIYICAYL